MKAPLLLVFTIITFFLNAQSFDLLELNSGDSTNTSFHSSKYYNASQLHDYDGDGDMDIIITKASGELLWLENDSTLQFPKHRLLDTLIKFPNDLEVFDFDKDGDMDYLVCSIRESSSPSAFPGELVIFERIAIDSFIKHVIVVGENFEDAAIGDFNNDNKMDFVVVGGADNDTIYAYINNGNKTFSPIFVTDSISDSHHVDVGDINNDDLDDIVLGGGNIADGAHAVYNNGNSTFSFAFYFSDSPSSWNAFDNVVITDLDQNGFNDFVAVRTSHTGGLYWFEPCAQYDPFPLIDPCQPDENVLQFWLDSDGVSAYKSVRVHDLDQNGCPDVVMNHVFGDYIRVLYQENDLINGCEFNFDPLYLDIRTEMGSDARISIGDIDADNDPDIIYPEDNRWGDITWYENKNNKLVKHHLHGDVNGPIDAKIADLDGDGKKDIVVAIESQTWDEVDEIVVYKNLGNDNFLSTRLIDTLGFPEKIEVVNLDGDSDLDILFTARDEDMVVWLENDGSLGDWAAHTIDEGITETTGIAYGNVDNDSDEDVVVCSKNDDRVFLYLNDGNGNFSKVILPDTVLEPIEVEIIDINNDTWKDIVVVGSDTSNTVCLFLNNGGGGSYTKSTLLTGFQGVDVEVGDWDNDGMPDILAGVYTSEFFFNVYDSPDLFLLKNTGSGEFENIQGYNGFNRLSSLKLIDLDNDSDLDLIIGNSDPNLEQLYIMINVNGSLGGVGVMETRKGVTRDIDAGDVNDDGKMDIVFTDDTFNDVNLFLGKCPEEQDLVLDQTLTQGIYNAANTINSAGHIGFRTKVMLSAGSSVTLNPDFNMQHNSDDSELFIYVLDTCPSN